MNAVRRLARPLDYALAAGLFLAWLLPITFVGLTAKSFTPVPHLNWLYNVACLFAHRQDVWPVHHVEIRTADSMEWQSLPFDSFTPMETFGYRSRLDRRLASIYEFRNKRRFVPEVWQKARAQESEIAEWVRRRWNELHPQGPRLVQVRMLRTSFWFDQDFTSVEGHWRKEAFVSAPDSRKRRFGKTVFPD